MIDKNDLPTLLRATPSRSKRELLDAAADEIESLTMLLNEALEDLRALREERRWISVEERMPAPRVLCLTYRPYYGLAIEKFYGENWSWDCNTYNPVTHWMPLPEPPEVSE